MAYIDSMTVLDSPVAYLLLPATLMLVWFFTKEKIWQAVFAGRKSLPSVIEEKVVAFKEDKFEPSMGDIVPLTDLDWKTEEPRTIYKFNPKYFLTMGMVNRNPNLPV
jgi:hypothetical protein